MDPVVIKPIITEKSMKLAGDGFYTFGVMPSATKPEIAKFVAEKFNVKVLSVHVINVKGRTKAQRKVRGYYQTSKTKKAIVQVAKGQKISLFDVDNFKEPEVTVTTADQDTKIKEKKDLFKGTKVKVEKMADVAQQTTQRKVITGK